MPDYSGMGNVGPVIIPAGASAEGYVELSPTASGRVFRKHILNLGDLHYHGKTYKLDDSWYARLADNFSSGIAQTSVPLANERNQHSEDPLRNTGEIIGIEREGNKVYTVIDVRDPEAAQRIADKRILGASAFLHMDYEDTRTGKRAGPALLHHCLTNRPHVVDLEPYQEVIAATADSADMDFDEPVVLAGPDDVPEELEVPLSKDELLAQLKTDHGLDVEALQAAAAARQDNAAQLTQEIVDALKGSGAVQLTGEGDLTHSDVVGAIVELAAKNETLGEDVRVLKRRDAEHIVDDYIGAGRLLPKSREKAVAMQLSNPSDLEDFLSPADAPYVRLASQAGVTGPDGHQKDEVDIDAEVARLTAAGAEARK